jgi:hypothetical protein
MCASSTFVFDLLIQNNQLQMKMDTFYQNIFDACQTIRSRPGTQEKGCDSPR